MKKRIISIFVMIAMLITMLPTSSVYADTNVATEEVSGSTGSGTNDWKYGPDPVRMGVRISFYWAPRADGDNVTEWESDFKGTAIQVGRTTDFASAAPYYGVDYYSTKSVFDYMRYDDTKTSTEYKPIFTSGAVKYKYNNSLKLKTTIAMPDPTTATAKDWEKWFESPDKDGDETYVNIPIISKACGYEIEAEDFKYGTRVNPATGEKVYGVYKIFFEPLIAAKVNGKATFWTFRDAIRYGEKSNSTTTLVNKLSTMFAWLGNKAYLVASEKYSLNMVANSYSKKAYTIDFDAQTNDYIIKQLAKNGNAYNSLGLGVINPQRKLKEADRVKVIATYVKADVDSEGKVSYAQVGVASTSYLNRDNLDSICASDIVSTAYGSAYLNDVITSPIDLTKKSYISKVSWENSLPKNESTDIEIEPTADDIWSYNFSLKTKITFAAENGILAQTDFDDYLDSMDEYTKLSKKLKTSSGAEKVTILAQMQLIFCEALTQFGFDDSYNFYKSMAINPKIAVKFLQSVLDNVDVTGLYSKSIFIKDIDDIKLDSVLKANTDGIIYLRYIIQNEPKQVDIITTFKDGDLVSTVVAQAQSLVTTQKITNEGIIKVDVKSLRNLTSKAAYVSAKLVKVATAKGIPFLTKMPTNPIKTATTLGTLVNLDVDENVYVEWRIDKETPVDGELEVPEWRLSKYDSNMKYSATATMSLKLTQDNGHRAWSTLSPSGTYKYSLVNPNGKVTTTASTPENMKYSDWLHSKAKTKGSYAISHSNPSVAVDVAGELNAIKSTALTGIKVASWTVNSTDKSKLADYDIETGIKSTFNNKDNANIEKTDTLSYGIRNKNTYNHNYGYYSHYTVHVADSDPDDDINDSYSYSVCNCTTIPETPSASYVSADYKIRAILNRYKATSTASNALKVKASKTEENGKTTIAKQNSSSLYVYPEIPMLFQNDAGANSIVFAVGTQSRKVSLVDYHTLDYTAYVNGMVSAAATAMDSKAKVTAKNIGLGSLPVALKGSVLTASFNVKKSKSSNETGILTVKSYALDIDDGSLKTSWGNEDYSSKSEHTKLLAAFNDFSSGKATEKLDIAVPGGTNSAYTGATVTNKITYKQASNTSAKHDLTVRGGVLTKVDGKSVASIKSNDKELYAALVGMKLVASDKDNTVFATFSSGAGDKLNEATFATLANAARGISDISIGKGWYFEDSTSLILCVYTTTYTLPISGFSEKIPMSIKGLETPINKAQFYSKISKGYNILNYTMTSKSFGTGIGAIKVYFEHNSRTDSTYGDRGASYGVSNTTITDSTFGGF